MKRQKPTKTKVRGWLQKNNKKAVPPGTDVTEVVSKMHMIDLEELRRMIK